MATPQGSLVGLVGDVEPGIVAIATVPLTIPSEINAFVPAAPSAPNAV